MDHQKIIEGFDAWESGNMQGGWSTIQNEIAWHSHPRNPGDKVLDAISLAEEALRTVRQLYEGYRPRK